MHYYILCFITFIFILILYLVDTTDFYNLKIRLQYIEDFDRCISLDIIFRCNFTISYEKEREIYGITYIYIYICIRKLQNERRIVF